MLENELCSSRVFSSFRYYESGDEELSVLPRHTKVVVTGNNRTKSVLVGLQGVVKKAVGLGGWHWLVLKNGVEVKLQRNALSVLEHPTGKEENDDYDLDDSSSDSEINNVKDNNLPFSANNVRYSRIGKTKVRYTKPSWGPSGSAKTMCQSSLKDIQTSERSTQPKMNFAKLGTGSLWRYIRMFKLATNPNSTKEELVDVVHRHFSSQERVHEGKVIREFIHAAKRLKSGERH